MNPADLPFRPAEFCCAEIQTDLDADVLLRLGSLFAQTRLTRCSNERFHLSYQQACAAGQAPLDALKTALYEACVNEMVLEALGSALDKAEEPGQSALP